MEQRQLAESTNTTNCTAKSKINECGGGSGNKVPPPVDQLGSPLTFRTASALETASYDSSSSHPKQSDSPSPGGMGKWEKLSPQQFQELQEYISYATHSFKEVVARMTAEKQIEPDSTLDYNQFVQLMTAYLDADVPGVLLQAIFGSLLKRRPTVASVPSTTRVSAASGDNNKDEPSRTQKLSEKFHLALHRNISGRAREMCLTSSTEHISSELREASVAASADAFLCTSFGEKSQSLGHLAACCIEPQSLSGNDSGDATSAFQTSPETAKTSVNATTTTTNMTTATFVLSHSASDLERTGSAEQLRPRSAKDNFVSRFIATVSSSSSHDVPSATAPIRSQSSLPSSNAATSPASFIATPAQVANQEHSLSPEISSKILMRDLSCYLSLLEGGRPEDKLEFLFRLYDSDGNGILDSTETEAIVNQMMNVAGYLGWECSELRPILQDMMREVDTDDDGFVSLVEWKRGGMTTIPLLVLLGLDTNVHDDGSHSWRLKHFRNASYCNLCLNLLLGLGKKGLMCVFCHYTAHEKCVQWAPQSCIATYSKSRRVSPVMYHVWIQGNVSGKCEKCKKTVKCGITGCRCRWCMSVTHNKCVQALPAECNLGPLRDHVLPPTSIIPVVLEQRPRRPSTSLAVCVESRRGSCGPTLMPPALGSGNETAGGDGYSEGLATASTTSASPAAADGGSGSNYNQPHLTTTSSAAAVTQVSSPHLQPRPASFQIQPLPGTRPLLVFVNPKSGGHQGMKILAKFQHVLNPRQVYNLIADRGPYNGLNFFREVRDFRILCCGGDGTIGWLMDAIDKVQLVKPPPIAMLPLGTGNDLARCLRWGGGYEDEALVSFLQRISLATEVMLDRWRIEVEPTPLPLMPEGVQAEAVGDPVPFNIMNNYFSIGVDASIAHRFHVMREKHPEKFNSRMRNKLWYLELGTSETFSTNCKNLHEDITIWCDGEMLDLSRGPPLEAIAVLNIPSIYGGSNLWGDTQLRRRDKKQQAKGTSSTGGQTTITLPSRNSIDRDPDSSFSSGADYDFVIQDIGDRLFEVVGLESTFHAASVYAGLRTSAIRLRQCQSCTIRTKRRFPMQIDGEPWLQPPCTIRVNHMNQVPMLMAPKRKKVHPILHFLGIRK